MQYMEQKIALERDHQVSRERNTVGFSGLTNFKDAKWKHGSEDANSCWGCHSEKHPNNIKCIDCGVKGQKSKGSAKCSKADSPTGVCMLAASGYKTSHDKEQWPARRFGGLGKKAERKARQSRTRKRSDDLRNVLSTYDDS